MLAAHPTRRTQRLSLRRSRAPLRICSPPAAALPKKSATETPAPRTGEVQPIGQLLPQVLARYLSMRTED
jgi:hypothetical protein